MKHYLVSTLIFAFSNNIAMAATICNPSSENTNVRAGPSAKNFDTIASLSNGDKIEIIERVTNVEGYEYLKVQFQSSNGNTKETGYVYHEAIPEHCTQASSNNSADGELEELDLPKSGLTEAKLENRSELLTRMFALTMSKENSVGIDEKTYHGSDEFIDFHSENFTANLGGETYKFKLFQMYEDPESAGCATTICAEIETTSEKMCHGISFNISGSSFAFNEKDSVVEISNARLTWPEHGQLEKLTDAYAKFVKNGNLLLAPYNGENSEKLIKNWNEVSSLCKKLDW